MVSVIKVETFDVDAVNNGTYTLSNSVGSVSSAFVRKITSTDGATGPVGSTANAAPQNAHAAVELTGVTELTFRTGSASTLKHVGEVWRYTGAASGLDEFINRGTFAITLTGTSATQTVPGIVNRNKCVPFLDGITNTITSTSDYELATVAVHIDSSGDIVVSRRGTGATLVVYVTVVEFTGSNWTVGHGLSASHDSAIESVTLNSDSTGTGGAVFDVNNWASAHIIAATMEGDTTETGLADVLALVAPGTDTTKVTFSVVEADSAARNDGAGYVHVLAHASLSVTRSVNTNYPEGNNTYTTTTFPGGVPAGALIDELALEWFASTSGTGTAHARGRLTGQVTSITGSGTIQTWVHRSGNTVRLNYGLVDLSKIDGTLKPLIETAPAIIDSVGTAYTITGQNFEAFNPGLSKVEIWSDFSGTVKAEQTIDVWSTTSIDLTAVTTGISDGIRFFVITSASGGQSIPRSFTLGLPTYENVMDALSPDHFWKLDGVYDDTGAVGGRPMTQSVTGTQTFTSPICDGTVQSVQFTGTDSRREAADNNEMNTSALTTRTMGGWIRLNAVRQPLTTIYKEGGSVNNLAFLIGYGNILMAQLADTGDDNVQAYSDFGLKTDRNYRIDFRYDYTTNDEFELWIDGVKQTITDGNPLTATDLDSHSGDITWGVSDTNLEMGGTDVAFVGNDGCYYSFWSTFRTKVSDADIRFKLFEYGALPDITITSDTPANMQAALDLLADTVRPDTACAIRIERPVGATDLTLSADNITFADGVSIHVQWIGSGTLTWTNLNGSDASISSVLAGGTVNFVNPATLTLTGLQANTEVRVYEAGTETEVAGIENVVGSTFSSSIQVPAVDIAILSLGFLYQRLLNIDTSAGDVTLPINQRVDRQYENL